MKGGYKVGTTQANNQRICVYDLENMAALGWHWGIYDQTIIKVQKPQHLLSIAYKWVGEKKVHILSLPDYKLYKKDPHNDYELVKAFWEVMNEADVLVGHNSKSFDTKMMNAAFMRHKLPPPAPYKQVDTKTEAKKSSRFLSNKLDDLGDEFQIGKKMKHQGFDLWLGCDSGDVKCWKTMCRYNVQDVKLTEKLYLELRPWMTTHPPMGIMDGRPASCDNCGSSKLHNHTKKFYAKRGWYMQYKCYDCGAYKKGAVLHAIEDKTNRLD